MGVRAEQQAFAKHGLNYVIDEYLPREARRTPRSSCPDGPRTGIHVIPA